MTEIRLALAIDHIPGAGGDPLLQAAHAIAGLATIGVLIARWLAELDAFLRSALGAEWWRDLKPFPIA